MCVSGKTSDFRPITESSSHSVCSHTWVQARLHLQKLEFISPDMVSLKTNYFSSFIASESDRVFHRETRTWAVSCCFLATFPALQPGLRRPSPGAPGAERCCSGLDDFLIWPHMLILMFGLSSGNTRDEQKDEGTKKRKTNPLEDLSSCLSMTLYPLLTLFAQKYLLLVLSSKHWRDHNFRDHENKSAMMVSVWHLHTSSSHRAEQAAVSSPVPPPPMVCGWDIYPLPCSVFPLRTWSLKCVVQLFSMAFAANKRLLHSCASPRDPLTYSLHPRKRIFRAFMALHVTCSLFSSV